MSTKECYEGGGAGGREKVLKQKVRKGEKDKREGKRCSESERELYPEKEQGEVYVYRSKEVLFLSNLLRGLE